MKPHCEPHAVIDVGTNTVLLLAGRATPDGAMEVLADVHAIARLGEGVDASARIRPQALQRLQAILLEHRARAREQDVDVRHIVAYGTSALRDARNQAQVCAQVESSTGIPLRVLSGEQEAHLTFLGAAYGLSLPRCYAVLDIGGGSTEVAIGQVGESIRRASADVGAVRLTERYFQVLPPPAQAQSTARDTVAAALDALPIPPRESPLVGVAGTVTTLGALDMGIQRFDAEQLNGHLLRAQRVRELSRMLLCMDYAQIRRLPQVAEQRADLITAGALILDTALRTWDMEGIVVSTRGLRYGLLQRELGLLPEGMEDRVRNAHRLR